MSIKSQTLSRILTSGLVPVIRTARAEDAIALAEAIRQGGAGALEITMTVPGALDVLKTLSQSVAGSVAIGAGTVLDGPTARAAILAGAEFIVTPCLDTDAIAVCRRYGKVVIPGALTPTEILLAWEKGADMVKVFPADLVGGPRYLKAIKAPLPQVELVPTGGVEIDTAAEFIRAGASAVAAGGGLIGRGDTTPEGLAELTRKTEAFLKVIREARAAEPVSKP